jgi:hypothetical protein
LGEEQTIELAEVRRIEEMIHGRSNKTRANKRTNNQDSLLTPASQKNTESLERRVASLEFRIAELEKAVDRASGTMPVDFLNALDTGTKKKPGPQERINETELLLNRDNIIEWIENKCPQIVKPLLAARNPRAVATVLRGVATKLDIRPEWQRHLVGHPAILFNFLRSGKFRIKPPKKTLVDALHFLDSERRRVAADRLPTRQIANAMAGLPKLKWRTSLDKCSKRPSSCRVGHNTSGYYRAKFGIHA